MAIVLLSARLLLALIFGVAGTAKAADLAATRKALAGFGVPEKLAAPLGSGLPFVELLIALALVPVRSAWFGAVAGLVLLVTFATAIGVNLRRGQKPDCNCFGQLHSRPVSWSVFTRNLMLAALAALVVVEGARGNDGLGPGDIVPRASGVLGLKPVEMGGLVLGLVAVGLLATAVVYLRRMLKQQATVLERIDAMKKVIDEDYAEPAPVEREDAVLADGLPVGAPAPSFSLAAIAGGQVALDDLLAYGKSVLLLFVTPNCGPCEMLLPAVKGWELDYSDLLTIAVLSKGTPKDTRDQVEKHGVRHLLLVGEHPVAEDYRAKWTPAAVLVSRYGRIASQVSYGDEAIRGLVDEIDDRGGQQSASNGARRNKISLQIAEGNSALKVGDPAPHLSLVDLDGETVFSEDFLGRDTLLLFWDPGCPFCRAMSEDIRRWEENPPKGAPRLVFIASGDAERIEADSRNFESLFLHDRGSDVGPLFGTSATPAAVLIDRDGRIASTVAVGLPNALAVAGIRKVSLPVATHS